LISNVEPEPDWSKVTPSVTVPNLEAVTAPAAIVTAPVLAIVTSPDTATAVATEPALPTKISAGANVFVSLLSICV